VGTEGLQLEDIRRELPEARLPRYFRLNVWNMHACRFGLGQFGPFCACLRAARRQVRPARVRAGEAGRWESARGVTVEFD
jgi:hypothetical protein